MSSVDPYEASDPIDVQSQIIEANIHDHDQKIINDEKSIQNVERAVENRIEPLLDKKDNIKTMTTGEEYKTVKKNIEKPKLKETTNSASVGFVEEKTVQIEHPEVGEAKTHKPTTELDTEIVDQEVSEENVTFAEKPVVQSETAQHVPSQKEGPGEAEPLEKVDVKPNEINLAYDHDYSKAIDEHVQQIINIDEAIEPQASSELPLQNPVATSEERVPIEQVPIPAINEKLRLSEHEVVINLTEDLTDHIDALEEDRQQAAHVLFESILSNVYEISKDPETTMDNKEIELQVRELFEYVGIKFEPEQIEIFVRLLLTHEDLLMAFEEKERVRIHMQQEGTHEIKLDNIFHITNFLQLIKKIPIHLHIGRLSVAHMQAVTA